MTPRNEAFAPFARKMQAEGLPELAIRNFAHYYALLRSGETGTLSSAELGEVGELPDASAISASLRGRGEEKLARAVVIKLNGGLGTSMGMAAAKSLLKVRGEWSFLDIIVRQILHLRRIHGAGLPLVLMNSFRTREDSRRVLDRYSELDAGLPLDFVQHKVPRIAADGLGPIAWAQDPAAEWCPPGHGDLYPALCTSGLLEQLLGRGLKYAFVSNADNLGAVLDPALLAFFADSGSAFLMEVADRTESDKKGGHLARLRDGRLTLRESAQCPASEHAEFQDIRRHRYFNTNNLWIDLEQLQSELTARDGVLPLPMILNRKHVVPSDRSTPEVFQLETAMGAALSVFANGQAIRVPRERFLPVKTTSDLLIVRSDVYEIGEDFCLRAHDAEQQRSLFVQLGAHFTDIERFEARFPHGPPSLREARSLRVDGDVTFGRGVTVRGVAEVDATDGSPLAIEDGAVLGR